MSTINPSFFFPLNGPSAFLLADEVLALPRAVTQVTLAAVPSLSSLPLQGKWPGKESSLGLGQLSCSANHFSPWIIYSSSPCSVASQVDGACEGLATGCSCGFLGSGAEQELHSAGETGQEGGEGLQSSLRLPPKLWTVPP